MTVGGTGNSSTTTISVPVIQPGRFEVTKVEVPDILMAGEEGMLSVTYINKGKNPACNVTAKLECTGLTEEVQEEYIGNVAAGTQDSVDFDVSALTAGTITGKVIVVYENADGDEVNIEKEISFTVEEAYSEEEDFGQYEMYEDIPMEPMIPVWVYIVGACVVAGVIIAIVFIAKKKNTKKLLLEESLDDDEDI